MATDTAHFGDSPVDTANLDGAAEPYPRNRLYVKVALILAGLTVLEVMTHVVPDAFGGLGSPFANSYLLILMAAKLWTVAFFFMHLKWDNKVLTWAFYTGLVLAVFVYLAVMTVFRLWWGDQDPSAAMMSVGLL